MAKPLSPQKLSRILALYFEGYSQLQIADKLKVNQATVSHTVVKFNAIAEQHGLEAAAKEYDIMVQVKALHSLGAELKASKLTVEEAKLGVEVTGVFKKCGVKQEDYQDLVQACLKMKSAGYMASAIKLNKLEKSTGLGHAQIVAKAHSTHEQLQKDQKELQAVKSDIESSKKEMLSIANVKKLIAQSLEDYKKQIGVQMGRLKAVETLALTLKKAGISDKEIQEFIQNQQLLNKAGFGLDTFTMILGKAKIVTSHDGGEELLKMLEEYGGLVQAKNSLHVTVEGLKNQAAGLEEQAKLKGKLEIEVAKLKAEKASLEAQVAGLQEQKEEFAHLKDMVSSLGGKKGALINVNADLEKQKKSLVGEVKTLESKVSDLKELEVKRDALLHELAGIEARIKQEKGWWEVFESFLGVVHSTSQAELEQSLLLLPYWVEQAQKGEYSTEHLKSTILQELAGPTFQVLRCKSCGNVFYTEKPAASGYFQCPGCLSTNVIVDKDALAILKVALAAAKPTKIIYGGPIAVVSKQPEQKNKGKA